MGRISEQIKSVRQTIGRDYIRPDVDRFKKMCDSLWNNDEAVGYLRDERGLTDETIKHFKLGYDSERNAISIPIFKGDDLVNIKYRYLKPDKNKYTGEKGAETWLYNEAGIQAGLKKNAVLVVEGEFDLMSVWQSGIDNVVSPASGKDSYGVWIELIDNVPRVWLAYDNDEGGKQTSKQFAERLGVEKCYEVKYPDGIKDANEYFKSHTKEEFKGLIEKATPYYSYQFKNVGDIINALRTETEDVIELETIPKVKIEKDWLMVVSGVSNVGKTSYVLNIAKELGEKKIPNLIMPFERGITSVGKRYLQVLFEKSIDDLQFTSNDEWEKLIDKAVETPTYFALPKKNEIVDTIIKSKRLFDTKVVIIDHLDYVVRHTNGNRENEIANTLQNLKTVAEENGVVIMIVTHVRKIEQAGSAMKRKPNIEDLKGSASLYQDPECVVMLTSDEKGTVHVEIVKNKGEMTGRTFGFDEDTGSLNLKFDPNDF